MADGIRLHPPIFAKTLTEKEQSLLVSPSSKSSLLILNSTVGLRNSEGP